MAVLVSTTEQFDRWMEGLNTRERKEAAHSWRLLAELGLQLDYPHCSAGGNKASDKKMYDSIVPQAETIWEQHLKDVSEEDTK